MEREVQRVPDIPSSPTRAASSPSTSRTKIWFLIYENSTFHDFKLNFKYTKAFKVKTKPLLFLVPNSTHTFPRITTSLFFFFGRICRNLFSTFHGLVHPGSSHMSCTFNPQGPVPAYASLPPAAKGLLRTPSSEGTVIYSAGTLMMDVDVAYGFVFFFFCCCRQGYGNILVHLFLHSRECLSEDKMEKEII